MTKTISILLFSAMLLAGTPAWAADEHHPVDGVEAQSDSMNMSGSQAPMGGMMSTMGTDAMSMMGMMTDHIEGRLAFLKIELGITSEQEPKWNAFAEAVRDSAKAMRSMRESMMQGHDGTLLVRLEQQEKLLSVCLETLQKFKAAMGPLYTSFSDEQKRMADQLIISPMGLL